jgi:hypothetical protein
LSERAPGPPEFPANKCNLHSDASLLVSDEWGAKAVYLASEIANSLATQEELFHLLITAPYALTGSKQVEDGSALCGSHVDLLYAAIQLAKCAFEQIAIGNDLHVGGLSSPTGVLQLVAQTIALSYSTMIESALFLLTGALIPSECAPLCRAVCELTRAPVLQIRQFSLDLSRLSERTVTALQERRVENHLLSLPLQFDPNVAKTVRDLYGAEVERFISRAGRGGNGA